MPTRAESSFLVAGLLAFVKPARPLTLLTPSMAEFVRVRPTS
ncbi:MAG TPA: hypothetical protein VM753_00305 [Anaeromyxobacter sp.]|nr:hypothetical protein [Anaeromyxobacter sp.]